MDLNAKIELKDIDFNKVKAFLKKKETIITFFVIIFTICILYVANMLISDYKAELARQKIAVSSYEKIINSDTSLESLQNKIDEVNKSNEEALESISEIGQKEVAEFLIKIQEETRITWVNKTFSIKNSINGAPKLKAITVTIPSFSGTYNGVKDFFSYIENYERKVTIDSINFSRDKLTGKMTGSMTLTFYMINEAT